jgi:hypothetical protein
MRAFEMKRLAVFLAVVLIAPGLAVAQQNISSPAGMSGLQGVSGANTISGTLQNTTTGLGNAAGTAVQGLRGQNVNANLNTNQNTTGINIGGINYSGGSNGSGDPNGTSGSGEGYIGSTFASPSQYIGFGSSVNYSANLPQLPGFLGVPSNFSQPYKPDLWVNGPGPIVPSTLTRAQADECRSSWIKSKWDGGERPAADSIELIWPSLGQKFPTLSSPTGYVGTSKAQATEKYSFMATVCQAAYEAMKRGATKGIVTFVVRPKNRASGIGFGTTVGGTGMPSGVTTTHPYALAGALGFGTGTSQAHTEGELLMHIVGLRETEVPKTSGAPMAGTKPPQLADKPRDDAERQPTRATDRAWFGAPASQPPQGGAARPEASRGHETPRGDSPSAASAQIQQVAEKSPDAEKPQGDAGVPRTPVADKAWFGGGYGAGR